MEYISQVAIYKLNKSVKKYTDCLRKNEQGRCINFWKTKSDDKMENKNNERN